MSRRAMQIDDWIPILVITSTVVFGVVQSTNGADEQSERVARLENASEQGLVRPFVEQHCLDCHAGEEASGGLSLSGMITQGVDRNPDVWEQIVRKLTTRQMPPPGTPRPDEPDYDEVVSSLETSLDRAASADPQPGRTDTFRRLNRTEYQNAIRDLLDLPIEAAALLPPDESSHGFDNITVTDLTPTLLNRYLAAAQTISRFAVGRVAPTRDSKQTPDSETFRIRPDVTQDSPVEGLPIGTRGGTLIPYYFPQDGDYEVQVRLMRDRNEEIEGLSESHELEILLDRRRVDLFTIQPPPRGEDDRSVDEGLKTRFRATAGPHQLGVTFLKQPSSLLETVRQPLNVHFNYYRHPRIGPAVYEVAVTGPFAAARPGDTPSRRKIFIEQPTGTDDEASARRILSHILRRAYRRPIDDADLEPPMAFFRRGHAEDGFDAGIEQALSAVLVNPQFLFRIERDPAGMLPGTAYRISDLELASRLSFFLWSSIPDDELLDLAIRGTLSRPGVLEKQVRRMLTDERARSLVTNFGGQWLYLRNLDAITPDMRLFPDFDDNLRQSMRRETELFVERIFREDRSVLELIDADDTFLNERLATHYGIPHVYGSRFRRVALDDGSRRGGLLRQASILTVTSYATRTSPVLRGQWVLENFVGTPLPPPPPDIPALEDNTVSAHLPVRKRLAEHRADVACAACHDLLDPVGLSLENFDAVGRWRETEFDAPVDSLGGLPDGSTFRGVSGLEEALLARPELFVRTLAEKLLTFALGRGLEPSDAPAVRQIVRRVRANDYRFSSLILGIVESTPFQMRTTDRMQTTAPLPATDQRQPTDSSE